MNDFVSGLKPPSALWTARRLVALTLAYNVIEAAIALWSGVEADSIALFGFGLDSVIEIAASAVMFWGLVLPAAEDRDRQIGRFIGGTFLALALYVSAQAVLTLWQREVPDASMVGIVLAVASLVIMPLLAWRKLGIAKELGSRNLEAEAKETLACSYLSLSLLLGLGANAWLEWWWADPVAALLMVPWLVREGFEGIRGDECCCN